MTWELERQKNSFLQPAVPAHADCRAPLLAKHLTPAPAALLEPHTTARPSPGFNVHVVRLLARNGKSRWPIVASCLAILLCLRSQLTARLLAEVVRQTAPTVTLTSGDLRSEVRRTSAQPSWRRAASARPLRTRRTQARTLLTGLVPNLPHRQMLNRTLSTGRIRRTLKAEAAPRVDSWRVPRDRERAAWEAALAGRPQYSGPDAELATALVRYVLHHTQL